MDIFTYQVRLYLYIEIDILVKTKYSLSCSILVCFSVVQYIQCKSISRERTARLFTSIPYHCHLTLPYLRTSLLPLEPPYPLLSSSLAPQTLAHLPPSPRTQVLTLHYIHTHTHSSALTVTKKRTRKRGGVVKCFTLSYPKVWCAVQGGNKVARLVHTVARGVGLFVFVS